MPKTECDNCGTEHEWGIPNAAEKCVECCDHENKEEEFTRTWCPDCQNSL